MFLSWRHIRKGDPLTVRRPVDMSDAARRQRANAASADSVASLQPTLAWTGIARRTLLQRLLYDVSYASGTSSFNGGNRHG
jgi:hypothetical protein